MSDAAGQPLKGIYNTDLDNVSTLMMSETNLPAAGEENGGAWVRTPLTFIFIFKSMLSRPSSGDSDHNVYVNTFCILLKH